MTRFILPSTRTTSFALLLVGGLASLVSACEGGASIPPADPKCGPDAIIEDAENGDDQIVVVEGRGGYIYTYADELGTSIEPAADAFQPGWPGAHKSRSAIHIKGKLAQGEAYAGFGFALSEPTGPYDASKYKGVSFLAKAGEGSTTSVRFKIPDGNTDPGAGVCTECFNDFGIDFAVTTEWTRYTVLFSDLKQEDGWGAPNPPGLDTKGIRGMQWQTSAAGKDYDLWVDDVSFVGCE
jgi:endoglucanase